ncbi:hypothetical protein LSTR_LSTR002118 [Laodelphax striatellus]|uniref:Uncharacterized protein n=1 Tax=Laodelphax striatellus TaxID=195883 RepID=A0A482XQ69_LAOST|nr:hypothetical protein LSTR_LSTR002118 [Laodelphax striatellus]
MRDDDWRMRRGAGRDAALGWWGLYLLNIAERRSRTETIRSPGADNTNHSGDSRVDSVSKQLRKNATQMRITVRWPLGDRQATQQRRLKRPPPPHKCTLLPRHWRLSASSHHHLLLTSSRRALTSQTGDK